MRLCGVGDVRQVRFHEESEKDMLEIFTDAVLVQRPGYQELCLIYVYIGSSDLQILKSMVGTKYLERKMRRILRSPDGSAIETKGVCVPKTAGRVGTKQDFPHVANVAVRRGSVGCSWLVRPSLANDKKATITHQTVRG